MKAKLSTFSLSLFRQASRYKHYDNLGYVHMGTISYRYRTGLISGTEKLTVHMGPVRYHTSFGSCSHGYDIVPVHAIARQN